MSENTNQKQMAIVTIEYNVITGSTISSKERYAEPITKINNAKRTYLGNILHLIQFNRTKNK